MRMAVEQGERSLRAKIAKLEEENQQLRNEQRPLPSMSTRLKAAEARVAGLEAEAHKNRTAVTMVRADAKKRFGLFRAEIDQLRAELKKEKERSDELEKQLVKERELHEVDRRNLDAALKHLKDARRQQDDLIQSRNKLETELAEYKKDAQAATVKKKRFSKRSFLSSESKTTDSKRSAI
jgi:DNA repair exonuclease SbcCD ATPase subunit